MDITDHYKLCYIISIIFLFTGLYPQSSLSEVNLEYVDVDSESSQMTPQESLIKSSKLGKKG